MTTTQKPSTNRPAEVAAGTSPAAIAGAKPSARTYDFGAGKPDPGSFPKAALGAAAQRVIEREGPSLATYPVPLGYERLRQLAVRRFERSHSLALPLSNVITTNGSMQ